MARGEELTDEQWAILAPLIPEPLRRKTDGADRGETRVKSLTVSCGFCGRVRGGRIYLRGFRPTRLATEDSSSGREMGRCAQF